MLKLTQRIQKLKEEKEQILSEGYALFVDDEAHLMQILLNEADTSNKAFFDFLKQKYGNLKADEVDFKLQYYRKFINYFQTLSNAENILIVVSKKSVVNEDGFVVGDIFYSSWGYEQTNIDFYQVLCTSKNYIWLAFINSTKFYTAWGIGKAKAIKDDFDFERKTFKTLSKYPKDVRDGYAPLLYPYENKAVDFSNYY